MNTQQIDLRVQRGALYAKTGHCSNLLMQTTTSQRLWVCSHICIEDFTNQYNEKK